MKNINVDPFDESTNTASTTDNNDSKLPYVSPSPGEFPIIGSTICVDKDNPTREEFVTARECGFSAGSSPVKYINNDSDVASSVLTTKFKPAMLNTGIGLLVNNASLIAYTTDHYPFNDPAVVKSYKIRMNYTVQQPFVTGLGLADEPHWHDDVPKDPDGKMDFIGFVDSGDPLDDKTGYVPAIFTNIYWVTENEMISKCNLNNVPYRQLHINLAASNSSDYIGTMNQYYKYLKAVEVMIHPQCWSFDLYPGNIGPTGEFAYGYHLNRLYNYFDRFLQISIETKRPFRFMCLTTEFETIEGNHQASPNINRLRFEVFTALAYGAQEIQYWTYCNRYPNMDEFYISSPINILGAKNQIWYSLKQVNEEIQRFSKIFMGCRVQHIEHIDNDYHSPLKSEMGKVPEFYTPIVNAPIVTIEVTEKDKGNNGNNYSKIFKGVMVSYITINPDNMSTGYVSNDNASSIKDSTEHYAIIVSHDPDNYKTLTITFKNDYEITELTPRVLTEEMSSSPTTIVRELMPGGYLIFRYRKLNWSA